jgi:hypothetical protein
MVSSPREVSFPIVTNVSRQTVGSMTHGNGCGDRSPPAWVFAGCWKNVPPWTCTTNGDPTSQSATTERKSLPLLPWAPSNWA